MTVKTLGFSDKVAALVHRAIGALSDVYFGLLAYGYLTTSERRVLAIERRLRFSVVRLIGRRSLMRLMGAQGHCDGSLRLLLAFRRDGGGVTYILAVELSPSADAQPASTRLRRRRSFLASPAFPKATRRVSAPHAGAARSLL